jgi:signal transduction histidine kinase
VATTATAAKRLPGQAGLKARLIGGLDFSSWPKLGVRGRQVALITLLVVLVAAVTTVANIAYMTGAIIRRTEGQASQLSKQITYLIQQDLARTSALERAEEPYAELASEYSGVRRMMESTIASRSPFAYLYVANEAGTIISDRDGRNELAANRHMINARPYDLGKLADAGVYTQLWQVSLGPPIYELQEPFEGEGSVSGVLHIGVSATAIRRELRSPIQTNLFIGFLAIVGAAIVAVSSANLLLKPLAAISTSIDRLGEGIEHEPISDTKLPQDDMVTGVTARLRQLGVRMAGERSELELMRGRLRQVISHLEERLLLINREGRVILASPGAETLLSAKEGELAGLPIDESLGRAHPLVLLVERVFSERRSQHRAIIHVPIGGSSRQLIGSIQYIEDAGYAVGALISLRDFESFQKFESQWDLSKKLADLGRITSGIAHEVKNPLNAMVIHLEILRAKLESGNADPAPQMQILDSEIRRLDRVVQTFLNFTRPVEIRLDPLDINGLVDQVVALAATEAQELGVTIIRELAPQPLPAKADADLMKQALLNIIINGCQAMPQGGPLTVATSLDSEGSAHIKISDKGTGIPQEVRDRIFNLYFTTKKGGTGIGLAQAFRAIQLHNGQIRFDSEPGQGTTFEITLPPSTS